MILTRSDINNRPLVRRQLRKIVDLLAYASETYIQPMVIHIIAKIDETFDRSQIRDVLRSGMKAKRRQRLDRPVSRIPLKLPYLYFCALEYKERGSDGKFVGLHMHLMLIVDQCNEFLPIVVRNLAINSLSKLKGIRLRDDSTPDVNDTPRRYQDQWGRWRYVREGAQGVVTFAHFLKKEGMLKDAIKRYSYLAKTEQAVGVPWKARFSSSQLPDYSYLDPIVLPRLSCRRGD